MKNVQIPSWLDKLAQEQQVEDGQQQEGQPQEGDQPASITPEQIGGEIEALKKELEDLKSNTDLKDEVEKLKKKIENLNFDDDTNLNDSIYQSAANIAYVKRAMRRMKKRASYLTTEQQEAVINELNINGNIPYQQLAKLMADKIGANQDDIYMFLTSSDLANQNNHRRTI